MKNWAVVAGASRGIGRSLALSMAQKGYSVAAVARNEKQLAELGLEIIKCGVEFKAIVLDLSETTSAAQLLQILTSTNIENKIRVICLNAATNPTGTFTEIPLSVHQSMMAVNVIFPMNFLHLVLPRLKGSEPVYVVTLSSQAAFMPVPWMAAYGASKSFMHNLGLALSYEFKETNIRMITAIPAATRTTILSHSGLPEDVLIKFHKGRPPEEIAQVIVKNLNSKPQHLVTNVKGFLFFRIFTGLAPVKFLVHSAGRMFELFKTR